VSESGFTKILSIGLPDQRYGLRAWAETSIGNWTFEIYRVAVQYLDRDDVVLCFSFWTSLGQSIKADSHVQSEIGLLRPRRGGSDLDLSMIDADMACQGLGQSPRRRDGGGGL